MARYLHIAQRLSAIIWLPVLLLSVTSHAQSISGATCVVGGGYYGPYTINGVSWSSADKWCVTGGSINGSSCINNNGAPSIGITWNPGMTSGTVSYYHPASAATPIATLTVSGLNAGSISPAMNMFQPPNVPVNVNFNNSSSATSCNGLGVQYLWEYQPNNSSTWTSISGATGANLSTTMSFTITTYFRRGAWTTGDSRVGYTSPIPVIIAQAGTVSPASQTIGTTSTPTTLTATAATNCNGPFNYQWQTSPDGTNNWTNISGATSTSYTPSQPLPSVSYYRLSCFCTGTSTTVYTNTAVINVTIPLTSGTLSPGNQTINVNTVAGTITATPATGGNGAYTYQWQILPNGSSTWTNINGATGLSVSPGVLSVTTLYRIASTSNGETVYSNPAVVSISSTTIYGVYAPNNSTGNANADMNWVINRAFDGQGSVISEGKQFFDNSGRPLQSQNKVFYRSNPSTVYTHVFASQSVRDVLDRPAATTLPAAIDNSEFAYQPNFVQAADGSKYTYKNFDRFNPSGTETDKTNNPDQVGTATRGTLGWYYSTNNIWEPYLVTTGFPYSRETYYGDGTGNPKKAASAGEVFRMGNGHEVSSYEYPITGEFSHYMQVRNKFFSSGELGAMPGNLYRQAQISVAKDANGRESFTMQDRTGKTLMTARPGNDITLSCGMGITGDTRYGDLTFSIDGDDRLLIDPGAQITVKTGSTLFYQGAASGFNITSLGAQTASVTSATAFSYQNCTSGVCGPVKVAPPAPQFHYVRIMADNTPVTISGSYTLYDMNTELPVSFNGSSLNKGFYRLVATSGDVFMQYQPGLTDVSYNFFNQLGQLVATIAPEGVKKLFGTGINNYATKNDVPFITLYEYDVQGRLIKSVTTDDGTSEMVYRRDGKIRFSQNAEQKLTGRYSYTNYDQVGRTIETGEYQPDAGGIAFTSDMSVSSAMKNIVENTSATGGLTTGTKRDVVITQYDIADNGHGLSGYIQDQQYLSGVVSYTKKYSVIVNNSPNSTDILSTTWFSYNEEGKIVWTIKYIKDLGYKTIDYTYDLLGRMTKKIFQRNTPTETFVHYYDYDPATQNLWKVYTNTVDNTSTRQLQATYIYYLHGPLKRIEIASDLQGIDYTYTLQGTLKAINNSDKTKDPGSDGSNGLSPDAFGMVLDYYPGDYQNNRTAGMQPIKGVNTAGIGVDNFAGAIKAMTWFSRKPAFVTGSNPGIEDPTTYVYQYDDKYQFTESTWGTGINFGNTPATFTATGLNKETIKHPTNGTPAYDANGNMLYLQRNNPGGALEDRFTYNYLNSITGTGSNTNYNTNKLQSVVDDATGTAQTYASYTYDKLGQLTVENTGGTTNKYIKYDVAGKVVLVARDAGFTQKVVEYIYDEDGQRIVKKSYNSSFQLSQITYYADDVVYIQPVTGGSPGAITAQEYTIQGAAGRLGIYFRPVNIYAYELNDQLGNVRAVIARNGSTMEVRAYTDYYPYGMVIRNYQSPEGYRYEFQGKYAEKEKETDWNAFELRMYDSRIGRWLQYDPQGEFWSPYIGMGNDPVKNTDPNGGSTDDWIKDKKTGTYYYDEDVKNQADIKKIYGSFGKDYEYVGTFVFDNDYGIFHDRFFGSSDGKYQIYNSKFKLVYSGAWPSKRFPWMDVAAREIGVQRILGEESNPRILEYFQYTQLKDKPEGKTDQTAWCAAFANFSLVNAGSKGSGWATAFSFNTYGQKLEKPAYGCIAVFNFSHVGFVAGINSDGRLIILGGNQTDASVVNLNPVSRSLVIHYRLPAGYNPNYNLPKYNLKAASLSFGSTH
jgi:uncharacterized protein (TIGR02594 family)